MIQMHVSYAITLYMSIFPCIIYALLRRLLSKNAVARRKIVQQKWICRVQNTSFHSQLNSRICCCLKQLPCKFHLLQKVYTIALPWIRYSANMISQSCACLFNIISITIAQQPPSSSIPILQYATKKTGNIVNAFFAPWATLHKWWAMIYCSFLYAAASLPCLMVYLQKFTTMPEL